jgi:hypothetical protein
MGGPDQRRRSASGFPSRHGRADAKMIREPVMAAGPECKGMLTGLGSLARVAILDRRGVGLSDRLHPKDLPSRIHCGEVQAGEDDIELGLERQISVEPGPANCGPPAR